MTIVMQLLCAACVALIVCSSPVLAQSTFDTCAAEGTAKRADVQRLNRKKNRDGSPTDAQINRAITFEVLLAANDTSTLFREGDGAEIVAYVSDVKIGAVETCNCGKKDHWYRDTHIELTLDPLNANDKTKILVVEVTPRFRQAMKEKGIDWSQRALRDAFLGRWVRVRGWVYYDALHDDESANAAEPRNRVWRGSAWEIHPVTEITVVPRPSSPSPTPSETTTAKRCTASTTSGKRCSRTTTNSNQRCWQHQ